MFRQRLILVCSLALLSLAATALVQGGENVPVFEGIGAATAPVADLIGSSRRFESSDAAQSYTLALQALAAARRAHDVRAEMEALLQAGKTARFLDDYPRALSLANDGLRMAEQTKNLSKQGEFHLLLSYIRWNLADLPAAFTNLLAAREISVSEHNLPLQIAVEGAHGLVEARSGNPEGSLAHLMAATDLAERTHDSQLPSTLNNLGRHFLAQKDYPHARNLFERGLARARDSQDRRLVASLLVNLGQVGVETGDLDGARRCLDEALATSERYHIRRESADVHHLLGSLERQQGHLDLSRSHLDQSLAIAHGLSNPDLDALIYAEYVATEEASGRFKEALDFAHKLAEQQEIIRAERNRWQIAELTAQNDAKTHLQQIKLLRRGRELDQAGLALKDAQVSRTHTLYSALALLFLLGALTASTFASRQRARARYANLALAETRAAKEQVEVADATKARLLAIAAQNLQASEARFRSAFELSPLGIALVGLDGRWLRINPALCHLLGYPEAELLATDFQSVTHPDDLAKDLDYVARLLSGEIETYQMEKRYFHRDGRTIWVRLDVSLIRDAETHEPRMFISQVQDVTARRRDEEQLHHAKEEAERANAAKNEFLSRMSHELRTPLNAILGFGQLLEILDLGEQQNQSVAQILTASRHLLELINEVLDISTIESGQFALALEPTSVHDVVHGVNDLVLPLAEQAGVRLLPIEREGNGCILADPRRLRQVLLNLLSNAIKYNHQGGEVSLSYRFTEDRVRIEVRDTGHGIAPEDLEKVFVPFSRLPTTQSIAGTGLGLSLSKALAEAMNGTFGVSSKVGTGSVFWVEFAVMADDAPWDAPALVFEPIAANFFEPEIPEGVTLLYVEDNAANLEVVRRVLSRNHDLTVISALDGKTGLEMAAKHLPDLILLDVHLPDMSGGDVLNQLRATPKLADIPVVVISADVSLERITTMEALGIREYLRKPFGLKDLRRAISDALHTGARF